MKLSGVGFMLEQDIQLAVGQTFRLRQSKVSPNKAEETKDGPEETSSTLPIPHGRVEHSRHEGVCKNERYIV